MIYVNICHGFKNHDILIIILLIDLYELLSMRINCKTEKN